MAYDTRTGATVAQLKDDIDAGRTGDKVANADPGLSPLGTDGEAGGNAMSPQDVALARRTEAKPLDPVRDTTRNGWAGWLLPIVIAAIAVMMVAFLLLRH